MIAGAAGPPGVLNGTGTGVPALLRTRAELTPDREAFAFLPLDGAPVCRWTYAELHAAARRVAGYLRTQVGAGDAVAVWARNAPEWVLAQLGCYLAGTVLVPINPNYGADEARYLLEVADVRLLLHDRDPDDAADLARRSGGVALPLPVLAAEWPSADEHDLDVPGDAVAQIQFTSGTTGRPKGALLTHAGLTTTPVIASRCLGLSDGARWLNVTPLFHIGGCVLPVLGCLGIGATHLLGERYRADSVLETFGAERVGFFGGVPTMWWDLLARYDPSRHDIGALEVLMTGGAPVPDELVRRAEATFGAHVVVAYGQTEAHGHIAQTHIVGADAGTTSPSAVGRVLPHTAIEILRADGTVADPDEPGELVASSPTLMRGYVGRPEETAKSLDEQGRLHTGDVCAVDADGVVSFVGRLSELIVRGGEKVAPAEVEAALLTHPAVGRVAVAGVPDPRLGERVAAFVVPAGSASADELAAHLDGRLARFKIPQVWEFVDELPLAATGKVAKDVLVRRWSAPPAAVE